MNEKPKIISTTRHYRGRIINVRFDKVGLGERHFDREVVEHPGAVAALAAKDEKIYLVRQYRHPCLEYMLEVPAGLIETGEEPAAAMNRELEEETGIRDAVLEEAGILHPSPGYTDEVIHLFFTNHFIITDEQKLDEGECLDILCCDAKHIYRLLDNNEITDAKTAVLLYKYRSRILGRTKYE